MKHLSIAVKKKVKIFLAVVCFLASFAPAARAGHPLITDDAYTQGKNHFEFEFGAQYAYFKDEESKEESYLIPLPPAAAWGAAQRLDIVLAPSYLYSRSKQPHSAVRHNADILLEAKWQLLNLRDSFFAALKPGLSAPLSGGYQGSLLSNVTYSAYIILSYAAARWDLHLNSGYLAFGDNSYYANIWHNSLAAEYNFYGPFKLVGNIGFDLQREAPPAPYFALLGLCYSHGDTLDLDIGYKRVFNNNALEYAILAGVTFRI
jgi:hypothetical protein